jgi:S1-C subfamily serine protease
MQATVAHLPRRTVRELDLLSDRVVEVMDVLAEGPAEAAGVSAGDLIVALQGRVVTSVDDIHRLLTALPLNQPLMVSVIREDSLVELQVDPQ